MISEILQMQKIQKAPKIIKDICKKHKEQASVKCLDCDEKLCIDCV